MKVKRYDPRHILQAFGLRYLQNQGIFGINTISNDDLDRLIEIWKAHEVRVVQVHPSAPAVRHVKIFVIPKGGDSENAAQSVPGSRSTTASDSPENTGTDASVSR